MSYRDFRHLDMTAATPTSVDRFEQVLDQYLSFNGDPMAGLDSILADDPECFLAHYLKTCFMLYQTKRKLNPFIAESLNTLAKLPAVNNRERQHLAALNAWSQGDWESACSHWEQLLLHYPNDLLALKLCQDMHFFLGHRESLRDLIARALPHWSEQLPGYGYLLGMYAFGLEECGDYAQAERQGREAVDRNRKDAWAIHAVAHVMEMQGRHQEGIDWLTQRQQDWAPGNFFAVHNWWHLALYHFDLEQFEQVLALYDQAVRQEPSKLVLNMIDASALLWRLYLANVDCAERAQELAGVWQPLAEDGLYAFNDIHATMAFVMVGDDTAANALLNTQTEAAKQNHTHYAKVASHIGLSVCQALLAFSRGQYQDTVALLLPIRYDLYRLGGSHAQRDIITLTLLEAALRDHQHKLAQALLAERLALKPDSPYHQHRKSTIKIRQNG